MGETVISLKNIEKKYGKHNVLRGINLDIKKGDIFGIIGKNGAGKTTIFKIILGFSKCNKGEIKIGDKDLYSGRKKIGFFIGENFFSYLNAKENLEYYRILKGVKDKDIINRVLKIVELDKEKSKFKDYSTGMKQRLGIANALLSDPEILILDEPTNGLDPQGIANIRNLIKKLNEEFSKTVIISSHILSELQNTAHRFAIVNDGVIANVITEEELLKSHNKVCISVDDIEKAKKVLKENNINIYDIEEKGSSLEDFYFEVIGGKNE